MMELPEALTIAGQINKTISGKRISGVTVSHTPHKLAWYYGEPGKYPDLLIGKTIGRADAYGGLVEVKAGNARILFGEGVGVRFHGPQEPRPPKHQLLIEFGDRSALSAAVQMYGGLGSFLAGELDNPYYKVAKEKPSPISSAFNKAYFERIIFAPEVERLSLKALLATEQRIPGLGNGVLQDILFKAGMHPKKKVNALSEKDHRILFDSIKKTLAAMAARGGRDTELDLFGRPGGYKTLLSKNTVNKPCPVCGALIKKESYMGGSVYYCEKCQRL
ncbi:MAG: zinc finger domain-containing protein [Candidatus Aminicenantales bacterium]